MKAASCSESQEGGADEVAKHYPQSDIWDKVPFICTLASCLHWPDPLSFITPSHGNPEHQVALNLRPKAWQVLTQCWLHDCGLEWECVYGSVCAIALILPPLPEPHRGSTEIHF